MPLSHPASPPFPVAWSDTPLNRRGFAYLCREYAQRVLPELASAGVKVLGFQVDGNPFHYAQMEYQGDRFFLSATEFFDATRIQSFARIIQRVCAEAKKLCDGGTPVYISAHDILHDDAAHEGAGLPLAFSYINQVHGERSRLS